MEWIISFIFLLAYMIGAIMKGFYDRDSVDFIAIDVKLIFSV
jgi:hypothetical protein